MADLTINNFRHFLEDLEKNLKSMDELFKEAPSLLKSMHVSCGAMSKMCENWSNQLEHRK